MVSAQRAHNQQYVAAAQRACGGKTVSTPTATLLISAHSGTRYN